MKVHKVLSCQMKVLESVFKLKKMVPKNSSNGGKIN